MKTISKTISVRPETMEKFIEFQIQLSADMQQKLSQDDILNYWLRGRHELPPLDKEIKK